MTSVENKTQKGRINERLATSGLRFTPQRQEVYDVLLHKRDHPTAEEVFFRAKQQMPDISMATVYNCLDALVKCGLVKQVNVDRGATRFCPNMHEHCHFHCDACGGVYDIDLDRTKPQIPLPRGFRATQFDLSIRGLCPDCAAKGR
ncbi:MAG TPA: Fur family transcriptional regulator [Verrucomicrobiae bacterium]|nr:Fur family transcriptional regulator [Verrucomicrobiae bacterium]